jgi:hypothetical protein
LNDRLARAEALFQQVQQERAEITAMRGDVEKERGRAAAERALAATELERGRAMYVQAAWELELADAGERNGGLTPQRCRMPTARTFGQTRTEHGHRPN